MKPLDFIMAVLATYRLSYMLSKELGPRKVFLNLRERFPAGTSVGDGLRCPFCLSVHFAAAWTAFFVVTRRAPLSLAVLVWLAISGGSVAIHKGVEPE